MAAQGYHDTNLLQTSTGADESVSKYQHPQILIAAHFLLVR
jgi:hypothetical protein